MKNPYHHVTDRDIEALSRMVGSDHVLIEDVAREKYGRDETEDLFFPPEVVVRPGTAEEVAEIIRYARQRRLPITPRGAGTGLSGGALPVLGGIVLSVERMNRILEIDPVNMMAVVEPGVITAELQAAVEREGLFYPPDPASRQICFIGGNVAENAGGPRALKYGVTRDYVYGLDVVLGTGEFLQLGGKLYKNVAGYDLLHLMVGSEGTLGVFTRIILRLIPLPPARVTVMVPFRDEAAALQAVPEIFRRRMMPSAIEFIGEEALAIAVSRHGAPFTTEGVRGLLLIQIDGPASGVVEKEMVALGELLLGRGAEDVLVADSPRREEEIWNWRRGVAEAVKQHSIYKEEDAVVPRERLADLVHYVRELSHAEGFSAACYGHAGDGNVHINILKEAMDDRTWHERLPGIIRTLFRQVVAWGGSITGEHGVGWVQRRYLPLMVPAAGLAVMRAVKRACDPDGIMNPLKIFPEGD